MTRAKSSRAKRQSRRRRLSISHRRPRVELLEDRRVLATFAWDGGGDGVSWGDPLNWDNDSLPGPADDAVINVPGDITIDHSANFTTINSLQSSEAITLSAGTLNVTSTFQVDNTLTLAGGTLSNATILAGIGGSITANSNFANRLSGVTLDADLDIVGQSMRDLRLSNGVTINGTITVSGSNAGLISDTTQTIGGSGTIQFAAGSGSERDLSVEGGTTLTLGENLTVRGGGAVIGGVFFVGGNSFVINRGTILADMPGQVLRIDAGGNGTFTNEGLVHTTGGELTLLGSWDNNGTLEIDDATLNLDGTFSLDDLGTLDRAGGTVNLKGTLDNTDTTLRLDATTGSWVIDGGSINNGAIELVEGSTLVVTSNFANRLEWRDAQRRPGIVGQ